MRRRQRTEFGAGHGLEQVGERRVRESGLGVDRPGRENRQPALAREPHALMPQRRLADAGLAGERERRDARARPRRQPPQRRELVGSPDDGVGAHRRRPRRARRAFTSPALAVSALATGHSLHPRGPRAKGRPNCLGVEETAASFKPAGRNADIRAGMLPHPSLDEQAVIAETMRRPGMSMTTRERLGEGIVSVGLVVAIAILWALRPPGDFNIVPAFVCWLVLVGAWRVRIDTPFGFTVPTQLAFVPLVFAMPGALVPIAVIVASMVGRLPDVVRRQVRVSRLVHTIPNAWFTIGPVAVFTAFRVAPDKAAPAIIIAAFAAQFIVDFLAGWLRYAITRGATFMELFRAAWVVVVDAALTAIALLAADQIHRHPVAALAPLPLIGLIALFARERRQRLESLIELNTAYRRARDEAVEASNLKSAFLRNVSHEIRTPMNGVIGMNDLLLATDLNDEQREFAAQVQQSGEHMLAVINDLLDISTIERGHVDLDPVEFDLRDAVGQACAIPGLEAQAKALPIEVVIDHAVPERVRGDRGRLRQVLMNLVGNAVKFTTQGSVSIHVSVASPGPNSVRFEVVDTGIGIEPAILDRMFEPFVQADVSMTRRYGGNGLGLAIAKELVELMGGMIGATSVPGAGSAFWFELPLPVVSARSGRYEGVVARANERVPARPTAEAAQSAGHVLVVEDSPVNRLVAIHVLERCGFRVHAVNDGQEALQALSTQTYDAVLMDCQMPNIDGYAATRELRRREEGIRHTPVIAMTAHAMSGDRERCLAAGMDDYVTKPVRSQALADVLRRWIGRIARRRRRRRLIAAPDPASVGPKRRATGSDDHVNEPPPTTIPRSGLGGRRHKISAGGTTARRYDLSGGERTGHAGSSRTGWTGWDKQSMPKPTHRCKILPRPAR